MQDSRDLTSHLFHLPKCKVRVWSPWDATSRAFQARGDTQLNPWVPLWAGEMCKLGTFIYASAARCAFLPPVLQATPGKPNAVMKTAGQPASFQQWGACPGSRGSCVVTATGCRERGRLLQRDHWSPGWLLGRAQRGRWECPSWCWPVYGPESQLQRRVCESDSALYR